MSFKIMDAAIMNGFETLTKLGGYIMLFSMIAALTGHLPIQNPLLRSTLVGIIEITNGIQYTTQTSLPLKEKYLLCVAFTAFGGLSGLAQTSSMVAESGLPMKRYLMVKLLLCLLSVTLAELLYPLFV